MWSSTAKAEIKQKERRFVPKTNKTSLRIPCDLLFEFVLFIRGRTIVLSPLQEPPEVLQNIRGIDRPTVLSVQQKSLKVNLICMF